MEYYPLTDGKNPILIISSEKKRAYLAFFVSVLLAVFSGLIGCSSDENSTSVDSEEEEISFVHQNGNRLNLDDEEVFIRGINSRNHLLAEGGEPGGNWIDYGGAYTPNDSDLPFNEIQELDWWYNSSSFYNQSASIGFNSHRLILNYRTFENDASPGDGTPESYKDSGWDFIDRHVAWAEERDMFLVLAFAVTPNGALPNQVNAQIFGRMNRHKIA